jgi:hypothetical protein
MTTILSQGNYWGEQRRIDEFIKKASSLKRGMRC